MNDYNNMIFKFIGNGMLNKEIVQDIKDKLLEKYGEPFEVSHLGERFGTYSNNTVKAYCYPLSNENLRFTAILNNDRVHFKDDYSLRLICYEIEEFIKNEFLINSVNAYVRIATFGIEENNEKNISKEIICNNENISFLAKICINEKCPTNIIKDIMSRIKDEYSNIELKGIFYVLEKDYYNEIFEKYSIIPSNIYINIKNKEKIKSKNIFQIKENTLVEGE